MKWIKKRKQFKNKLEKGGINCEMIILLKIDEEIKMD